jgi:hypothetical protein
LSFEPEALGGRSIFRSTQTPLDSEFVTSTIRVITDNLREDAAMPSGDPQSGDTWVARVSAMLDDVTQTIERLATHITVTLRHSDPHAGDQRSSRQAAEINTRLNAEDPPNGVAPSSAETRSASTAVKGAEETDEKGPLDYSSP